MYTDYTEENKNNDNNEELNDDYYEDNGNSGNNGDKIKKIGLIALIGCVGLILLVLIVKGCSNKKDNVEPSAEVERETIIALSYTNLALKVGAEHDMIAQVLFANDDNPIIVWSSEDTSIATINDDGRIVALQEGITKVIATYTDENDISYSEECTVIVTNDSVEIEGIQIEQGNFSLKKGDSAIIQVNVLPSEAVVGRLIYLSDNLGVASVSDSGYVSAIGAGTTTITVKTEDEKFSDSVTVTVVETGNTIIEPTDLIIYGLTQNVYVGGNAEILTSVSPTNATNKSLTYESSDPSIATVSNGTVAGKKAGKCIIIVSTSNNISKQIEVEVHSNQINVTDIQITNGTSVEMLVGGTRKITYSISPSNATNKKVTFSSSNPNVAMVISNGIVAALKEGTAAITVKTEDGKYAALVNIVVKSNSNSPGTTPVDNSNPGTTPGGNTDSPNTNPDNTPDNSNNTSPRCTPYDMISVVNSCKEKDQNCTTSVSTNSFAAAVPYTDNSVQPQIHVTELNTSCASSFKYSIYYGTTEKNLSSKSVLDGTISVGTKIPLNKGSGYYKVVVTAKSNGVNLEKNYYAIVDTFTVPTVNITRKSIDSNNLKATVIANCSSTNYNIKYFKYCANNLSACTPSKEIRITSPSKTTRTELPLTNVKPGYNLCVIATDTMGNSSEKTCITLK